MPTDRQPADCAAPTVEREYEVVKRTKAHTLIVWTGGCRNCAYMIAAAAQRDAPDARVSVVRCG